MPITDISKYLHIVFIVYVVVFIVFRNYLRDDDSEDELLEYYIASASRRIKQGDSKKRKVQKPKKQIWFTSFLSGTAGFDDENWRREFRMSRKTFLKLFALVDKEIRPQQSHNLGRPGADIKYLLAAILLRLSKGLNFEALGKRFGLGKSTLVKYNRLVLNALWKVLHTKMQFPEYSSGLMDVAQGFNELCSLPNCIGAIGSTFVSIESPSQGQDMYLNRKGLFSVNVQAIVDCNMHFLDVNVGAPGASDDCQMLKDSDIYQDFANSSRFLDPVMDLPFRPYLIGGNGYPQLPWLMTPFPGDVEGDQKKFNDRLERGLMLVEHALAKLKSTWRILKQKQFGELKTIILVVIACFCLQNFLADEGEDRELQKLLDADETLDEDESQDSDEEETFKMEEDGAGIFARNALLSFLVDRQERHQEKKLFQ